MRKLYSHEWDQIIYMISTLPVVIGGLLLLAFAVYEQTNSAISVILLILE